MIKAWVRPYSCGKQLRGVPQGDEPLESLWAEGLLCVLDSGMVAFNSTKKCSFFDDVTCFEKDSGF